MALKWVKVIFIKDMFLYVDFTQEALSEIITLRAYVILGDLEKVNLVLKEML